MFYTKIVFFKLVLAFSKTGLTLPSWHIGKKCEEKSADAVFNDRGSGESHYV